MRGFQQETESGQSGDESDTKAHGQEFVSPDQTQQIDDRLVDLALGMAVTAEIKTGSCHIIEYLLWPILRHRRS